MATQYPSSLPPWETPVSDQQVDQYIRFSTDVGAGKVRKNYTGEPRILSVSFVLDGAQRVTLDNFYSNNVDFDHEDPKDDSVQTFRFREAPSYELRVGAEDPNDRIYNATLNLFRLP